MNIKYFFLLLLGFSFTACSGIKKNTKRTNMLFETLFDSSVRGDVKTLEFDGSDMLLEFNCKGHLNALNLTDEGTSYVFEYSGDSIINNTTPVVKTIYLLNNKGKVSEMQSWMKKENWVSEYKENWTYDKQGRILEKKVSKPATEEPRYSINREVYRYRKSGSVEIEKLGTDGKNGEQEMLLRTEVRIPNENGDWKSIQETDEDGLPFRSSEFNYTYDRSGNWTQVIVKEINHYTGKNEVDTLKRVIGYYGRGECKY